MALVNLSPEVPTLIFKISLSMTISLILLRAFFKKGCSNISSKVILLEGSGLNIFPIKSFAFSDKTIFFVDARVNHQDGANITLLRDFNSNTDAPGSYMYGRMQAFANDVNKRLDYTS